MSEETALVVKKPTLSAMPVKGRKKLKVTPLTEAHIEDVLVDKEAVRVSQVHFSSSLKEADLSFTYEAVTDWGEFNVKDLVDKMVLFSSKLNGVPLYDYQIELQRRIFESVLLSDGEEITGLFSRQSGKTETLAQTCNTLLVLIPLLARIFPDQLGRFKRGYRIGLFAPTNEQAYTTHSRMDLRLSDEDADAIMSDSDVNAQKKYSNGVLQITGADEQLPSGKIIPSFRSFCKVQSAAKQTKIESKTYDLILIDEAQEVDTLKVQKSIHPMISSTNGCLTYDTPVFCADGLTRKIGEIVSGELPVKVMAVANEDLADFILVPKSIEAYHINGIKPCKKITLKDGRSVEATFNHHFVRCHNVRRNQWEWSQADSLEVGDRIAVPVSEWSGPLSEDSTYPELLGYLISEGCLTDCSIEVALTNPDLIRDVASLVEAYDKSLKFSHSGRKARITNVRRGTRERNVLQSRLVEDGLWGLNAFTKKLPEKYLAWDNETLSRYLRRLFAGDGCLHYSRKSKSAIINYDTVNKELAEQTRDLLQRFGIYSYVKPNKYQTPKGRKGIAYRVHISSKIDVTKFLSKIGWMKPCNDLEGIKAHLATEGKIKELGVRFVPIAKIENVGLKRTFDIQVADSHNYVAGGILSHNTMVKIGTCTTFRSDFYDATIRNKRKYIKSNIQNHFEFDYKTCQRYNKYYKSWVTKERERIGEDSDAFRMAFRLEWLIEKGMAITPQMYEEYMKVPGNKFEYAPMDGATYVAGLDLGKENDSTVMTIARIEEDPTHLAKEDDSQEKFIKTVVNWIEMIGDNWEVQFETVVSAVRTYGIKVLAVDSTGVGDVIYDRLERVLEDEDVVLVPVLFNLKEKHAMATLFYEELRAMRIRIPAHQSATKTKRHQNFLMQFYACEKVYNKSYMQLKHGEEKDAHDDFVDSLLLMCYGVEQNLTPRAKTTDNFMRHGGNFKPDTHRSRRFEKAVSQYKRLNSAKWRRYGSE
jgi:intein/homing endonuclease